MAAACRRIRVWEINMLIGIGLSGSARWVWLCMNRHAEAWCGNNVTPAGSVKVVWMLRGAAGAVSGGIQPDRRSPQSHRGRNPNYRCALDSYHDLKNLIGTFTPLTWTSATSKATSFRRVKCNSTATSLILDWVSVWLKSLQITSKSPKEKEKKTFFCHFWSSIQRNTRRGDNVLHLRCHSIRPFQSHLSVLNWCLSKSTPKKQQRQRRQLTDTSDWPHFRWRQHKNSTHIFSWITFWWA